MVCERYFNKVAFKSSSLTICKKKLFDKYVFHAVHDMVPAVAVKDEKALCLLESNVYMENARSSRGKQMSKYMSAKCKDAFRKEWRD